MLPIKSMQESFLSSLPMTDSMINKTIEFELDEKQVKQEITPSNLDVDIDITTNEKNENIKDPSDTESIIENIEQDDKLNKKIKE